MDINGTHLKFDKDGNPNIGYDVMVWIWRGQKVEFREIGSFLGNLSIDKTRIEWHTESNEVTPPQTDRQTNEWTDERMGGSRQTNIQADTKTHKQKMHK